MALVKLSPAERRRLSAFFSCLVLAVIAWVFTVLSSPNNFTVSKLIVYKNMPQKRAFHSLQSDTVRATIQGSGWQMLFSRLNDKQAITVDLSTLEKRNYVVLSTQLRSINLAQEAGNQIISLDPDTLYFDFSNRRIKKVPVKLVEAIKFTQQFAQSADAVIKPEYVTISGPAEEIKNITVWKTDTLSLDKINESVNSQLKLQPVKAANMSVYPKTVQVSIPVDEFTEKTLQIPVKLVNNSNYYNVKLFPQKVKVTFVTSLSDYSDMDEAFFEASANLNLWQLHGYTTLPVKINRIPPYTRIVKIEPAVLDFIIKSNVKDRADR